MIDNIITFINLRIDALGYFNKVNGIASRIEREGQVYPAIYNNANEYTRINYDSWGSMCYWRMRGEPTFSESESTTTIGNEYTTTIPLLFVGFMKKENATNNDAFFAENIIQTLIGSITTNSAALKVSLKAKRVNISATRYNTDGRIVAKDEFENVNYEPRYNSALFSIEFDVKVVSNTNCYTDFCGVTPPDFNCGVVRILDSNGDLIEEVNCGTNYTVTSATVHNSDNSYTTTVAAGGDLSLSDITFNVYVNGVLNQSFSTPSMVDNTINITG